MARIMLLLCLISPTIFSDELLEYPIDAPIVAEKYAQKEAKNSAKDSPKQSKPITKIMPSPSDINTNVISTNSRGDTTTKNTEKQTNSNPSIWTDPQWIMAVCAIIAVFVSIYVAIIIKRTLLSTEKLITEAGRTTDAAQETVKETRRIGEAQVSAYLGFIKVDFFINLVGTCVVDVHCKNSGNSPARKVSAFVRYNPINDKNHTTDMGAIADIAGNAAGRTTVGCENSGVNIKKSLDKAGHHIMLDVVVMAENIFEEEIYCAETFFLEGYTRLENGLLHISIASKLPCIKESMLINDIKKNCREDIDALQALREDPSTYGQQKTES